MSKRSRRRRSRLLDQVDGKLFRAIQSKPMDSIEREELVERLVRKAGCRAKQLEESGRSA